MLIVILAITFFLFLVGKFYTDYYFYDNDTLTYKEVVPSVLFVVCVVLCVSYGPQELIDKFDDASFRSHGTYTLYFSLLGLILAAFPKQLCELFTSFFEHKGAGFEVLVRGLGWVMVIVAVVRNITVVL